VTILQTLMGSSGTAVVPARPLRHVLQTLMGSSGTMCGIFSLWPNGPSNPHGFVWNTARSPQQATLLSPSNPHGFVWNGDTYFHQVGDDGLQTLMGSSGTKTRHQDTGAEQCLQTLMGSSGTGADCIDPAGVTTFKPSWVRLERPRQGRLCGGDRPFKPSWVRLEHRPQYGDPRFGDPSNPHGFVWNHIRRRASERGRLPFKPSWVRLERRSSPRARRTLPPFKPSWVRLERGRMMVSSSEIAPSNPHGFVWNPMLSLLGSAVGTFKPSWVRLERSRDPDR